MEVTVAVHLAGVLHRGGLPLASLMLSLRLRKHDLPGDWGGQLSRFVRPLGCSSPGQKPQAIARSRHQNDGPSRKLERNGSPEIRTQDQSVKSRMLYR
jgi:hypothetical protein